MCVHENLALSDVNEYIFLFGGEGQSLLCILHDYSLKLGPELKKEAQMLHFVNAKPKVSYHLVLFRYVQISSCTFEDILSPGFPCS